MEIRRVESVDDLKKALEYDYLAFSDSLDFEWSEAGLDQQQRAGWEIYQVIDEGLVISVLLVCIHNQELLTKNTPLRIEFQGRGHSQAIKDFFEKLASEAKCEKIFHYCRKDDFRIISLNKKYGYNKTENHLDRANFFEEWVKEV